jgi:uncharacterized protein YecE (DUF72 family)
VIDAADSAADAAPREIRIGTQGWNYPAWVGPFYPSGTRAADFLRVYARALGTVEVDSTFYAVPPVRTVQGWAERTPKGFRFALKLPREITHERKLRGTESLLAEFCDRVSLLDEALGPILVQMGPDFGPGEMSALERFLARLPAGFRFAVELRQREWVGRETWELLRAAGVAWAVSDGRWVPRGLALQLVARPTADFGYVRWMGPDRSLTDFSRTQRDRSRELDEWADALGAAAAPREIYGYVNNHFAGHSPDTVRQLQRRLGQRAVAPSELPEQRSLF